MTKAKNKVKVQEKQQICIIKIQEKKGTLIEKEIPLSNKK